MDKRFSGVSMMVGKHAVHIEFFSFSSADMASDKRISALLDALYARICAPSHSAA